MCLTCVGTRNTKNLCLDVMRSFLYLVGFVLLWDGKTELGMNELGMNLYGMLLFYSKSEKANNSTFSFPANPATVPAGKFLMLAPKALDLEEDSEEDSVIQEMQPIKP